MNKNEAIGALCIIAAQVMSEKFEDMVPADCICPAGPDNNFNFHQSIINFIASAVDEKLAREKKK